MHTISQGSAFDAIMKSALRFVKSNWKNILLLGIILGCVSAILGGSMIKTMDSLGLMDMLVVMQDTLVTGGELDDTLIQSLIEEIISNVGPFLQENSIYIILSLLGMLLIGTVIELYYGYMYFESENVREVTENKVGEALKQFIPYFLTNLLYAILVMIGLLLLIIPGIILMVYWVFVKFVMIKEKKYFFDALGASYRLVKNRRWETLGYMLLLGIIVGLISFVLNGIISYAVSGISDLIIANGIATIFSTIIGLFLTSVMFAFYLRRDQTRVMVTSTPIETE